MDSSSELGRAYSCLDWSLTISQGPRGPRDAHYSRKNKVTNVTIYKCLEQWTDFSHINSDNRDTSDGDELLRNDHNDPTDDDDHASSNADTDTDSNSEQTTPSKRQYLKGVYLCASAGSIVLLLNIILFAIASGRANSSKYRALNNNFNNNALSST